MDFDGLTADLRGVAFTNPTPFSGDGADVDHGALEENIRHLVDAGARLIIPCGNTGEYYSLSRDERVAVVETVVQAAGDASVVGGVGGSTKDALSLAAAYERAGADGLLVMHPVHTYVNERGLLEYYRRLAEGTELGLVLYKRGPELTHDHIATLSERSNVVGVKYAVNDVNGFAAAVSTTPGDLVWSNGIAERFGPSFAVEGAEAFTTGIGNFAPEASLALMEALREADWERARELRDAIRPFEDLRAESGPGNRFEAANNVPAVKYGMELAGLHGGPVREPLVDLAADDRPRAEAAYDSMQAAV